MVTTTTALPRPHHHINSEPMGRKRKEAEHYHSCPKNLAPSREMLTSEIQQHQATVQGSGCCLALSSTTIDMWCALAKQCKSHWHREACAHGLKGKMFQHRASSNSGPARPRMEGHLLLARGFRKEKTSTLRSGLSHRSGDTWHLVLVATCTLAAHAPSPLLSFALCEPSSSV
jgi:hypothetical protein